MRTFALAALAGFAAATPMVEMDYKFINYVAQFGKSYATKEEYAMRLGQFAIKEAVIAEENAAQSSYVLAHNKFSDFTDAEYKKMLGFKKNAPVVDRAPEMIESANAVPSFATGVNWVTAGAVTPVKDQGQCGSCWAFSSTGALEGAWRLSSGSLLSFSEQQLVDCVKTCMGCNGGWQARAFNYYESKAPMAETSYTYTAQDGTCQYNADNTYNFNVTTYTNVAPQSVSGLQEALAQQPVSVSIEADKICFQLYKSGVFDNTKCGTTLDHAVLAVGYGNESGKDYWLVKNSWGTSWGEEGYIKIAAVSGAGICGIQEGPLYPSV